MLPLLALGAVIAGGIAAFEAASPAKASRSQPAASDSPQVAASGQSYIVTPVGNGPAQSRQVSAADAVNNFIF